MMRQRPGWSRSRGPPALFLLPHHGIISYSISALGLTSALCSEATLLPRCLSERRLAAPSRQKKEREKKTPNLQLRCRLMTPF